MRGKSGGGAATATVHEETDATMRARPSSAGAMTPTSCGVTSSSNIVSETPEALKESGSAAPPATAVVAPSTIKKQRSIHDFFGSSARKVGKNAANVSNDAGTGKAPRKKRPLADSAPIAKRIDYDTASMDGDSSDAQSQSQASDLVAASNSGSGTGFSSSVKPKRIDFGGICPSSQRSEPDMEPANPDVVVSDPFARSASQSQSIYYGGGYGGMFSQDELDFCTPADQPVMHLSHPTTPSPMKKRQRRSHGSVDMVQEEEVQNLTQDMTHMDVGPRPLGTATPMLPNFSSNESNDMLLATPQRVLGLPTAFAAGRRRQSEGTTRPPSSLFGPPGTAAAPAPPPVGAAEAFTNPFAPQPPADSRKRRPPRKNRHSLPPTFASHTVSVPYSRYLSEFVEQELVGSGAFSKVYKVMKKLDGWTYAIKKSRRHFRGRADTERALREVQALAALSESRHVVRYFDAWIEEDLLYIQLEHCAPCSLASFVDQHKPLHVPEETLCRVLCHLAQALQDMHARQMVHMDVKLPNVLVAPGEIYKLGDLGTVALADGSMDITEGDNRYLSRELMEGSRSNLRAGDVFALGATVYELALGTTLPSGGEEWQKIRDGDLTLFRQYSNSLQHLIASMMHPDPLQRPSAEEILQHEVVLPYRQR